VASPDKKPLLLRLDPAVANAIEALAAQELRSVNGQIEWLLREALGAEALGRFPLLEQIAWLGHRR
jgi:hypothetical protein